MAIRIPKTFMGKPIEGSLKKVLEESKNPPNPQQDPTPQNINSSPINLQNPEDYILLPAKTHGNFSYAETLVSMYKLGMSPEVEQAAKQLGYSLENTAEESSGRKYIGNINWQQALKLNLTLGGKTLNPRRFADFILLLKSGNAVDGNGRSIPESRLEEIFNEITQVRSPWRSEWLDAEFKYLDNNGQKVSSSNPNGRLKIYSNHILQGIDLVSNLTENLEFCLMIRRNRVNFLTVNHQGMPIEGGNDFLYLCPSKDNNDVAGFVAFFDGDYLDCNKNPSNSNSSLGVRYCLPKVRAKF